eukprot:COSAG05_NODE_311_length_11636_cov_11.922250_8_plen_46_part_00
MTGHAPNSNANWRHWRESGDGMLVDVIKAVKAPKQDDFYPVVGSV